MNSGKKIAGIALIVGSIAVLGTLGGYWYAKRLEPAPEPFSGIEETAGYDEASHVLTMSSGLQFLIPKDSTPRRNLAECAQGSSEEMPCIVQYSCAAGTKCVILNRSNGETVDAKLAAASSPPPRSGPSEEAAP